MTHRSRFFCPVALSIFACIALPFAGSSIALAQTSATGTGGTTTPKTKAGAPVSSVRTFEDLNALLELPLLADDTLWDDTPSDAAERLHLPVEGKTKHFEGYRVYPRKGFNMLGADAHMISLQSASGKITALTIQFANRGDYPAFAERTSIGSPSKAEIQAFELALKHDFDAISAALTAKLGEPAREVAVGGLDAGRRSLRWEWGAHAILVSQDAVQMVSLKIIPAERAANTRLSDDQVRRMFKERITKRANGDVILDQIPMVNQGPKGYCVPATFERYLRYAGIPADMYELAASGGTSFGGGSTFQDMAKGLDRYVRRQGRRVEQVTMKLSVAGIARYIDEGRPIAWGLFSTDSFNALSNTWTEKRAEALPKGPVPPALLATLKPQPDRGHACMIIGYNRATNEIAFTDSWGPQFTERWVPAAAAQKVTQDEYWVIAW